MIAVSWVCWSIRASPFDTWRLSVVDTFSVCGHKGFSWMSNFRDGFVDIFYTIPLTVFDQLHFRSDMRGYVEVYMLWLGRFSFFCPGLSLAERLQLWTSLRCLGEICLLVWISVLSGISVWDLMMITFQGSRRGECNMGMMVRQL
jgi:hypothetical protein